MKLKLGELLVIEGVLSQSQVQRALERQRTVGGRLGTNLLELKFIGEYELATSLGKQHALPPLPPGALDDVPREFLNAIPKQLIEKHLIIPFGRDAGKLLIASMDPLDIQILHTMSFLAKTPLKVNLCPEARLHYSLYRYYEMPVKFRFQVLYISSRNEPAKDSTVPGRQRSVFHERQKAQDPVDTPAQRGLDPFLSPLSIQDIVAEMQMRLSQLCDRAQVIQIDGTEIQRWDSPQAFRSGERGVPLLPDFTENSFIYRYLHAPTVFCGPLEHSPQTGHIIGAIGRLYPPEVVIIPLPTASDKGYLIMGDNLVSSRRIETLSKIKRLHGMGVCALRICFLQEKIKSFEY